jgi:hypothetical protein
MVDRGGKALDLTAEQDVDRLAMRSAQVIMIKDMDMDTDTLVQDRMARELQLSEQVRAIRRIQDRNTSIEVQNPRST